jgi:hypothetical protein
LELARSAYGNAACCAAMGTPRHPVVSGRRTATLAAGAPLVAMGAVEARFRPRIAASFTQRPTPLLLKSFVSHVREFARAELGPSVIAA